MEDAPAVGLDPVLYEREVRSDPTPGDPERHELPEAEREAYCHFATHVVRHYEAIMELPAADL